MAFVLPRSFWEPMLAHVQAAWPNEGCGLLAGKDGRPVKWYPCANAAPNPQIYYRVDARDLLRAVREMEEKGWDLLAIFHSHPASPAYPSRTDVAEAHYPESLYLIASLADRANPVLRGFWIRDGQITEELVIIA